MVGYGIFQKKGLQHDVYIYIRIYIYINVYSNVFIHRIKEQKNNILYKYIIIYIHTYSTYIIYHHTYVYIPRAPSG